MISRRRRLVSDLGKMKKVLARRSPIDRARLPQRIGNVQVEPYEKHIITEKTEQQGTVMFKYWGAIGDYYYFLTFAGPLLRSLEGKKRVLAADVYPRYAGNPLLELCSENKFIDELWTHPRAHAGPYVFPPEFVEMAQNPSPLSTVYSPAIYYKTLSGPGVTNFPVEWSRKEMKKGEGYIVPVHTKEALHKKFPQLEERYITLQPYTFGKKTKNALPHPQVTGLSSLGYQIVIPRFEDRGSNKYSFTSLAGIPRVTVIDLISTIDCLSIQKYAEFHVGVESSMLLGAAIQKVHTLYFPTADLQGLFIDLDVVQYCHTIDWDTPPNLFTQRVEDLIAQFPVETVAKENTCDDSTKEKCNDSKECG